MRNLNPIIILLTIYFLFCSTSVWAETWDEPWQKEIIQNAEYFVLAEVISNIDSIGVEIEIRKQFGEQSLSGKLLINGFSLLNMTSASGHGLHLDFEKGQVFYFFLNKKEDGNFSIPTPTSGFAFLDENNNVYATYRHSYHQASVPQEIYEKTYNIIWSYYKNSTYDEKNIIPFIDEYLSKDVAGFDESEIDTFFLQHVAMETAYLLDMPISLQKLKKFIESDNFHARVSALQLLANSDTEDSKQYLFEFIKSDTNENFEKVIAIWALSKIGGQVYKEKLLSIAEDLSDESTGFGGNIMDPRVGTRFPSPRGAVESLE